MEVIRRILLDVFWTREAGTVLGNLSRLRRDYLNTVDQYNIGDTILPYFPVHEVRDWTGMAAAITTALALLRRGTIARTWASLPQGSLELGSSTCTTHLPAIRGRPTGRSPRARQSLTVGLPLTKNGFTSSWWEQRSEWDRCCSRTRP